MTSIISIKSFYLKTINQIKFVTLSISERFLNKNNNQIIKNKLQGIVIQSNKFILEKDIKVKLKLLWGPSFNLEYYSIIHNTILSCALKLRGVEIIPLSCNGIQFKECSIFGGEYSSYGAPNYEQIRKELCKHCVNMDMVLWEKINQIPIVSLSDYIDKLAIDQIKVDVNNIDDKDLTSFSLDNIDFGNMAKTKYLNNDLIGYMEDLNKAKESIRNHLISEFILYHSYSKILKQINPDRIISSGGDYYQYIILRILGKRFGIDCYHYNYAGREGTWTYSKNDIPNEMNFSTSWETFKKLKLSTRQVNKLNDYLLYREQGTKNDILSSQTKLQSSFLFNFSNYFNTYDPNKPLVLLASNIVWDKAALDKDIIFKNIFEWAIETITYFSKNTQFQLIVKPHPVENDPKVTKTKQTLIGEILKSGISIPSNVFLLKPETDISAYNLYPICDLGLIHTSTAGLELAMAGKPVILSGNAPFRNAGFTYDPVTKTEYFNLIENILRNKIKFNKLEIAELSKKFFYFYHFHYFIKLGIATYKWGGEVKLLVKSIKDILPGKNKYLDYICESIINNTPIVSTDNWPPES